MSRSDKPQENLNARARATRMALLPFQARNAAMNYAKMVSGAEYEVMNKLEGWADKANHKGPAIITASGGSLEGALDTGLVQKWAKRWPVFCTPTQYVNLVNRGVTVHGIVHGDPRPELSQFLPDVLPWGRIYTSPENWPTWDKKSPRTPVMYLQYVLSRSYLSNTAGETMQDFINRNHILPGEPVDQYFKDPALVFANEIIPKLFYEDGCNLPKRIETRLISQPNSTLAAVTIATFMGYSPVFLIGYDLSFENGRAKTYNGKGQEAVYAKLNRSQTFSERETGLRITSEMLQYLVYSGALALVTGVNMVNVKSTPKRTLSEHILPTISIDQVEWCTRREMSPDEREKIRAYLRREGVEFKSEVEDGEREQDPDIGADSPPGGADPVRGIGQRIRDIIHRP